MVVVVVMVLTVAGVVGRALGRALVSTGERRGVVVDDDLVEVDRCEEDEAVQLVELLLGVTMSS